MTDLEQLQNLLKSKKEAIAMLAPSFPIDFEYPKIVWQLRQLGFSKVVELTFGAKMVNTNYYRLISEQNQNIWIASPCPSVVNLIKAKYPSLIPNIVPVVSPMVAMARICKKYNCEAKKIFIGPCITKKTEASEFDEVDIAITFKELKELLETTGIDLLTPPEDFPTFDKLYNNYTKIYPLGGGLSSTLHASHILEKDEVKVIDGVKALIETFDKLSKGKLKGIKFIDCLFCKGGCIGGPGVCTTESIEIRTEKIISYRDNARKNEKDLGRSGNLVDAEGVNFERKF